MDISLNDFMNEPLYKQLEHVITTKIVKGDWLPGERIPSERQLSKKYKLNRLTISKAINNLVDRGILQKKSSSGTFVGSETVDNQIRFDIDFSNNLKGKGIARTLQNEGLSVTSKVLNTGTINNLNYFAKKLNLSVDESIFGLNRLRSSNDKPFALEYSYLPKKFFNDIDNIDFRFVSLYDYMISHKHSVTDFDKQINFMPVTKREAKLLKLSVNTLVYKIQYLSMDDDKNIVEYTESFLVPDKIHLNFSIQY
ncbi:GntR family transcriptional regulator [Pediococcus parvulus]|uniref:GntR family transcriptional regulator n=2 Tax=Pediococcus parvulus TaxID=54062 RepID=UPI00375641C6